MCTPLLLGAALAAAPDPALLARLAQRTAALEAFQQNSQLRLEVTSDQLDDAGRPKHTEVHRYLVRQKDGVSSRELLAHTEDGKDVKDSGEEQGRPKKKGEGKRTFAAASPFHPSEQPKYAFTLLPPRPEAPQVVRVGFAPKGERSAELLSGEATVDAASGELASLSMRPSKLPLLVDFLTMEAELKAETPAGKAMSKLVTQGQAGLPLFKKRFRVVMEFADYQAL